MKRLLVILTMFFLLFSGFRPSLAAGFSERNKISKARALVLRTMEAEFPPSAFTWFSTSYGQQDEGQDEEEGEYNFGTAKQYIGFAPDGNIITKKEGYKTIHLSPDSRFILGFTNNNNEKYLWQNGKYLSGTTEFTGWTANSAITGEVAVWRYSNESDCYRLYKYVPVTNYTATDLATIQDSINSSAGKWIADYDIAGQTDVQRTDCEKLAQAAIDSLNNIVRECNQAYKIDNPGSIAFYVNRNFHCLADLTQNERISMLQVLIEHVKGAGFGGDYDIDEAICRILISIPSIEEKGEIYNILKTNKLLSGYTLLETIINGMADDALVVFSKWLTEYIYEKKLYEASTITKNGNLHSFIYQTKKEVESGSILTRKAFALDLEAEKINGQIKIQPIRRWYSGGMVPVTTHDGDEKLAPVTVAPDEMIVLHFYSDFKYGLETIYKKDATIVIPALALWGIVEEKSERDLSLKLKAAAMILTLPTALEGGWAAAFTLIDELALGSSILIDDTGWRESVKSDAGKTWLKAYDVFITAYFAGRALEALGAFDELKQSFSSWEKVAVETKEAEAVTAKMGQLVKVDELVSADTHLAAYKNVRDVYTKWQGQLKNAGYDVNFGENVLTKLSTDELKFFDANPSLLDDYFKGLNSAGSRSMKGVDACVEELKATISKNGTFSAKQIDDYVNLATKNGGKNKVMLGMWDNGAETSYVKKAGKEYTYFDMGDEWSKAESLVNKNRDEMWRINKQFIDEQYIAKKEFWFSHDPFSPSTDQFFSDEVLYLIDLGAKDFEKVGNLWKAVW